MGENYRKEEVVHIEKVPVRVIHQTLSGRDCYCPLHWHKDIEINLFLQKPAEFLVNGVSRNIEAGDFIIINSGDLHSGTGDPYTTERDRYQELLTLQIDYDFLKNYDPDDHVMRFRDDISEEIHHEIRSILLEIGTLYLKQPDFYAIKMTVQILQLGSLLLEHCRQQDEQAIELSSNRTFLQIRQAVEYIETHYADEMSLDATASAMGWAPTYFSRKFRQLTGTTYHDYLTSVRLKHAMEDLTCSDREISEITFEEGFPNVKSFIEAFKKVYHETPQRYRSNLQKQNNRNKSENVHKTGTKAGKPETV